MLNAPAAFRFTAPSCPQRHLDAAAILGADTSRARIEDAGRILAEQIISYMRKLHVPNGLRAVGYSHQDIPALVKGTLPQHRVTKLSPRPAGEADLAKLFEDAMVYW
jgi:hydroxyacid-oxoacid transhydrogenase